MGPLMFYSSCRPEKAKVLKSGLTITLINSATSILAALVLFSFLGHISYEMGLKVEDVPLEGITLAFVAYPSLLTQLPGSNLWAIMFFLMLIIIGIDSVFGSVDYLSAFVAAEFPILKQKFKKPTIVFFICGVGFLGGLMFCGRSGVYMFNLFNHYAVGICLLFILLCESVIISWVFTIERINEKLREKTGEEIKPFFAFILKFITPTLAGISLLLGIIDEFSNPEKLPGWAVFFGFCLMVIPISLAIYGFTCGKNKNMKSAQESK